MTPTPEQITAAARALADIKRLLSVVRDCNREITPADRHALVGILEARAALTTTEAPDAVRFFWQQHTLSDTSAMSMAELHNDAECVIRGHRAAPMTDAIAPTEGEEAHKRQVSLLIARIDRELTESEAPAVDALEEGEKIMEKLWADPNGPFLKGQWEAPIAQPAVDALTTGAVEEPVAHFLHDADENLWEHVRDEFKGDADVVPLFRRPPAKLTDEQRKAIEWAIGMASQHNIHKSPLRTLLAHPASEPKAPYLPCPICNGVEGCDHTVPERRAASEPKANNGDTK